MIYLDNAATTFPKPESVYSAVDSAQRNLAVNAGRGSYKTAQKAVTVINETRQLMADMVHCNSSSQIVFSSSATIAMNQIIGGLNYSSNSIVYVSPFEHNAVVRPLYQMSKEVGFEIRILPFHVSTQELDYDEMCNQFALAHPDYIFATHISNVTGLILPYQIIFSEAKKYGAVTILDASQSLGLLSINMQECDVDFLVFAGHKNLYANFGVGGFVYNSEVKLKTFITGGTGSDSLNHNMPLSMPDRYEAASHDIIAISSLNASLKWLAGLPDKRLQTHKKQLTEYAVAKLRTLNSVSLHIPSNSEQHISVISFSHSEYKSHELAEILDQDFDIAVRSGYHCAPFVHKLLKTENTFGTVRVSIGYFNTTQDIDVLFEALSELE